MAQVIDRLVTEFAMRAKPYLDGAAKVTEATQRIGSSVASVASRLASIAVGGVGIAGASLIGLAVASSKASADLESLKLGLVAVEGSAEGAARRFKDIQKLAKLPSLGIEEAAQAYIDLAAAGVNGDTAVRAIQALGNALATVGKGKEVLAQAAYGLRQISTSSTVLAEDLNILKDAVPQVTKILTQLYGTARSEDLAKQVSPAQLVEDLIRELGKLPTVAGGASVAFDQFWDAMKGALASVGKAVNSVIVPALNKVSSYVEYLSESGKIQAIADSFAKMFSGDSIGASLVTAIAYIQAVVEVLPGKIQAAFKAFSTQFNEVRKSLIGTAAIFAALFAGTAIIRGVKAIVEVYKILTLAIKGAAVAQATLTALTGVGITVVLGALAAGVATLAALDKLIPTAGTASIDNLVGGTSIADQAKKNEKEFYDSVSAAEKAKKANQEGKPTTTPANSAPMNTLAKIEKNTERTAVAQEKALDIQTQLSNGSTLARNVTSAYGLSRTNRGGNGGGGVRSLLMALADEIEASMGAQEPINQRLRMAQ